MRSPNGPKRMHASIDKPAPAAPTPSVPTSYPTPLVAFSPFGSAGAGAAAPPATAAAAAAGVEKPPGFNFGGTTAAATPAAAAKAAGVEKPSGFSFGGFGGNALFCAQVAAAPPAAAGCGGLFGAPAPAPSAPTTNVTSFGILPPATPAPPSPAGSSSPFGSATATPPPLRSLFGSQPTTSPAFVIRYAPLHVTYGPPPRTLVKWGPATRVEQQDLLFHPCKFGQQDPALAAAKSPLDKLLPPRRWVVDPEHAAAATGRPTSEDPCISVTATTHVRQQYVSTDPATREDAVALGAALDAELRDGLLSNNWHLSPRRQRLFDECMDELIRQTATACIERAELLARVRDEHRRTLREEKALLQGQLLTTQRQANEASARAAELEARAKAAEARLEAREQECRARELASAQLHSQAAQKLQAAEAQHRDEVSFLEKRVRETERAVVLAVLTAEGGAAKTATTATTARLGS